jgi:hypothetical protein
MDAEWFDVNDGDDLPRLEFRGHYRFRGTTLQPKAAGTVMREMCNCIIAGQRQAERVRLEQEEAQYQALLQRKAEEIRSGSPGVPSGSPWTRSGTATSARDAEPRPPATSWR